jgi:hypothetical protein
MKGGGKCLLILAIRVTSGGACQEIWGGKPEKTMIWGAKSSKTNNISHFFLH